MTVFWNVAPYNLVDTIIRAMALIIAAASTSDTSVNVYKATRCNNPEGSCLRTHCRKNLKSNKPSFTRTFFSNHFSARPIGVLSQLHEI